MATPTARGLDVRHVSRLDPADLRAEYARRGLDSWPDARLIDAVAGIVSVPRRDPSNSFILHAPLELSARAALLPRIAPEHRELARLHILAVAAQYEAFGPPLVAHDRTIRAAPAAWVTEAIAAGDEEDAAAAARELSRLPAEDIVAVLTDAVAPLTAAAGHAPIFLSFLDRGGRWNGPSRELLVPLVRELARRPEWSIRWLDEPREPQDTQARVLAERLASPPFLGPPENTFIHPLMMQVDPSGFACEQLGDVVGRYSDEAAREVLRVAARSMLLETCEHAPYGWTHCLTMPQALLGLAPRSREPDRLLALAATEVLAFRTALGTTPIPTAPIPTAPIPTTGIPPTGIPTSPTSGRTADDLPTVDPFELATAAATAHDAHVVKYVLACLDAACWDPEAAPLFLAAGQRLLDCWTSRGGDPTDPLA